MRARFLFLAVHFLVSSFGRVGAYRSIPGIVLPLYTRLSNRRRGHGVQLVKEGVWAEECAFEKASEVSSLADLPHCDS